MDEFGCDPADERVARGAALLDEEVPGWFNEVDLGTLEIESTCRCVLGQLGGYLYMVGDLDLRGFDEQAHHGFDHCDPGSDEKVDEDFQALNGAWTTEILKRRDA